jgi:hypothetical protein
MRVIRTIAGGRKGRPYVPGSDSFGLPYVGAGLVPAREGDI